MNEKLNEFLLRSEVRKLSEEKRRLYEFIVKEEDQLAQKANTANHFLQLLEVHSPYEHAAYRFNLPIERIFHLMTTIEDELSEKIEKRYEKVMWVDYTNYSHHQQNGNQKKYVFLFVN